MTWKEFVSGAASLGVTLDGDQVRAFEVFEDRLYAANATINLTRVPRDDCRGRHFLDSLSLSPLIPEGASVIDIGSGAGLPGVPLALARPDLRVTLLDAGTKEIRFLESLADLVACGLILQRAEEAGRQAEFRERYDVAVGRALAPLPIQAELSAPFVRVGGLFLPQRAEGEDTPSFEVLGLRLRERVTVKGAGIDRL
ncbi:MAG: 16S rRNA (guanine(527)-N(7))-methyltransferase RsmG, partial [Fimbriimonadales bacterium]